MTARECLYIPSIRAMLQSAIAVAMEFDGRRFEYRPQFTFFAEILPPGDGINACLWSQHHEGITVYPATAHFLLTTGGNAPKRFQEPSISYEKWAMQRIEQGRAWDANTYDDWQRQRELDAQRQDLYVEALRKRIESRRSTYAMGDKLKSALKRIPELDRLTRAKPYAQEIRETLGQPSRPDRFDLAAIRCTVRSAMKANVPVEALEKDVWKYLPFSQAELIAAAPKLMEPFA